MPAPYSTQYILNKVRRDSSGAAIAAQESTQAALNAVFDASSNALRVTGVTLAASNLTDVVTTAETSLANYILNEWTDGDLAVGDILIVDTGGTPTHYMLATNNGSVAGDYSLITVSASTSLSDTANIAYLDSGNAFTDGQSVTIADTVNADGLTITQNDTTNNPDALVIANTGTGNDITAPDFSLKNGTVNAVTAYQLNSTDINTGGTLSNVTYLDQANTFTDGQSITIADTVNADGLTITQNDTTNNPDALVIANTGTGNDITAPDFSLKNGTINTVTAYQLNGTDINTGGTLSNVAYLDQANAFTDTGNTSFAGSIGIGTTPNANAILDVSSTTKAFMPPRMTETQRDAISSPAAGMVIYNTTTNVLNFHNGTAWGAV